MAGDFKKNALGFLKKAGDTAKVLGKEVKEKFEDSDTKKFLDEKGITEQAVKATDKALNKALKVKGKYSKTMDEISGAKIMELVEKRLEIQSEYNDILATKLEEALERIEKLEQRNKK